MRQGRHVFWSPPPPVPKAPGQWVRQGFAEASGEKASPFLIFLPTTEIPLRKAEAQRRGSLALSHTACWGVRSDFRVQVTLGGSGVTWTGDSKPHSDAVSRGNSFTEREGAARPPVSSVCPLPDAAGIGAATTPGARTESLNPLSSQDRVSEPLEFPLRIEPTTPG